MTIKYHTFKLGKYKIEFTHRIEAVTDVPVDDWDNTEKVMLLTKKKGIRGLDNALHEALHAEGVPDEYLHDDEGYSITRRVARFLWRLGYRKKR
jgi:hypothetical protein